MLGVNYGKVKVVPYSTEWPELYRQEYESIWNALGDAVIDIEHIGSTSIPGMPSKPILDIMATVCDGSAISDLVTKLCRIDYQYEADEPVPERHFFVKPPLDVPYRTHHLSVTTEGTFFWQNNLAFREYMLNHPDEAARYGKIKSDLAMRYQDSREAYTAAKQSYIKDILIAALNEFDQTKAQPSSSANRQG
ncbi:MAG: GrpB family protein [Proteobacteria bacterium]|nr:GrpB family protein [Pseudomonadota bacterium]MBU4472407.1 GrpB family protein [Pseudomonadota bacterium]MCG2751004.1 GrpB family protein [Desulfobacteraceae bacterium]